jgi:hypothetical protein
MSRNDNTDHYVGALLEDINHKFDILVEGQASMAHVPRKLDDIDDRLKTVELDVKTIKLAVKDQGKDHKKLKRRVAEHWKEPPYDQQK